MSRKFKLHAAAASVALALGLASGQAAAVPVALELALVIDVSGSVDASEYNLQMDGYGAAFKSATVQSAIESFSALGGIAVGIYFFATNALQGVSWTQLANGAQSVAFGTVLEGLARPGTGTASPGGGSLGTSTNVAEGMDLARAGILANGFEGARLVMDVSGDGKQNVTRDGTSSCTTEGVICNTATDNARDAAAAAGIVVNGLAIIDDFADLATWYGAHVKTATGFVQSATFNTFAAAIEGKIGKEIADVPEPTTIALLGASLLGFGFARRRKV